MPNQYFSEGFGDLEDYFITDYQLIDQYIGDTLWNTGSGTKQEGTNWKSVASSSTHVVAIKTDGTLWTWGGNSFGQLGVNDTTDRATPVTTLLGGTNWKSVDAGSGHTVAIKTDGSLWTWGFNNVGQLGVNDTTTRSTPVTTLLGGNNWKSAECNGAVIGGSHTLALKTDGSLWTWGNNGTGQLGINENTNIPRSTPVTTLVGGNNWKSISCGFQYNFAIKTDNSLWGWGGSASGQLGNNDISNAFRFTPVQTLVGGNNWKSVVAGNTHTVAIKTDGSLWVWGANNSGQLGVNDTTTKLTPVTTLLGGNNWKSIAGGFGHTIALKTDGSLWTWGANSYGQLGIGVLQTRSTPVTTLLGGNNWKSVGNGYVSSYAVTAGQSVDFS